MLGVWCLAFGVSCFVFRVQGLMLSVQCLVFNFTFWSSLVFSVWCWLLVKLVFSVGCFVSREVRDYSGVALNVARPDMNNYATLGVMLY